MNKTLENFKEYLKRIKKYEQASALISWDLQTAAPKKSLEGKLEALGFFSTEAFRLSTAECYGDMLSELSRPEIFDTLDDGRRSPSDAVTGISSVSSAFPRISIRNT